MTHYSGSRLVRHVRYCVHTELFLFIDVVNVDIRDGSVSRSVNVTKGPGIHCVMN